MREIVPDLDRWQEESIQVAVATVVETWGSAPRRVGAKMAMTFDGRIAGSVSGGCVEGAVYEAAVEVLAQGRPRLLHFGVADETAWDVGLACGGSIDVFVETLQPDHYNFVRGLLESDQLFATASVIQGPPELLGKALVVQRGGRIFGRLSPQVDGPAAAAAQAALASGHSSRHHLMLSEGDSTEAELFIEVTLPSPKLVIVGGVHIAIALTSIAKTLGYQTVVVDPRRAFGSPERFPDVDRLVQAWPDKAFEEIELTPSTAVASLTHDPKIDDPALKLSLSSPAFYVGALGSRQTHARRKERLLASGVSEERFARIRGPIGLAIGAQTPEEIALAIMAEIIAARKR